MQDRIRPGAWSRRDFMKAGLLLVPALAAACSGVPLPTSAVRPSEIRGPTPLPQDLYPTLPPATPEVFTPPIHHITRVIRRPVEFPDITSGEWRAVEVPKSIDHLSDYYNKEKNQYYYGFGPFGRDNEPLGWEEVSAPENPVYSAAPDEIFGYEIRGRKTGEPKDRFPETAFVVVDIPNGRKTYIEYNPVDTTRYLIFEFAFTANGQHLAINEVAHEEFPEKGVYIVNLDTWQLEHFVHAHVNNMQLSADGSKIYSGTAEGCYCSEIFNVNTEERELIRWPDGEWRSMSMNVGSTDQLTPDFEYIMTEMTDYIGNAGWMLKTPSGFVVKEWEKPAVFFGLKGFWDNQITPYDPTHDLEEFNRLLSQR